MTPFKRDELGIPVLNAEDIEALTERFLRHVAPACLASPIFTPIVGIMTRLQNDGHCTFSLTEDLGTTPEGYKYLGYFDIRTKRIGIDVSLTMDDQRFAFTVAHELGHFYLHSGIKPEALGKRAKESILDSTRDLVTHRIASNNPRTLLEWQANRFAAGLLMPRRTVRSAVEQIQRGHGVSRNLGTIWLDRGQRSRVDLALVIAELGEQYRVTRAVARYRIRELGILHVDQKTMPTRIGESLADTFSGALADLFRP